MRLLIDTNIFVDCLGERESFADKATLLMVAGKVGEFELWMSSSQITDLVYILSNGGKKALMSRVIAAVDGLLDFVNVFATSKAEIRAALASGWDDPEDALLHIIAQKLEARAIITRNGADFAQSLIPVRSAQEFFDDLESEGIVYDLADDKH